MATYDLSLLERDENVDENKNENAKDTQGFPSQEHETLIKSGHLRSRTSQYREKQYCIIRYIKESLDSNNFGKVGLFRSVISREGNIKVFAPPKGNDRGQMTAVVLGKCDVTLANTYYLGKWISSKKDTERDYAKKIKVLFPNQDNRGAHINISGGFVTKNAKNKDNAIKLIEFLAGDEAQEVYAKQNHEYPIRQNINISDTVKSWGYPFKMDSMNLTNLGELNDNAGKVFDIAKWK